MNELFDDFGTEEMCDLEKGKCKYCNDALASNNPLLLAGLAAHGNQEFDKAFALLLPFAEQNIIPAQCRIGISYFLELGTKQNIENAIKWLTLAGEQACPLAYNNLATIYSGVLPEIPYDKEKVRMCYQKAKANGFDMIPDGWLTKDS